MAVSIVYVTSMCVEHPPLCTWGTGETLVGDRSVGGRTCVAWLLVRPQRDFGATATSQVLYLTKPLHKLTNLRPYGQSYTAPRQFAATVHLRGTT